MKKELYIGLDVHREAVAIAVAEQGRKGEVRDYGQISNDLHALEKFITRLRQTHGKRVTLRACYEAGPCGFGVAHRLQQLGVECAVVAPSLTPTRAGDRLKTDKRDARKLARLLRAGELTAIYIPEPTDEAIRGLCRARSDAVDDRRRSRHRLKAFLLRHGPHVLERSARTVLTRADAAASSYESDPGGISHLGATGQRADCALRSSNERFVRQMAIGAGGARAHGHERLPNRSGDDRSERTGSAGSLHSSAAGDGVSGPGAERKVFQ